MLHALSQRNCKAPLQGGLTLLWGHVAAQAEMKEVLREQNESNDRLKAHTNEFHELLRKNTPA